MPHILKILLPVLLLFARTLGACSVVVLPPREYFHATPIVFLATATSMYSAIVERTFRGQVAPAVALPWVLLNSIECGGPDALRQGRRYIVAVSCRGTLEDGLQTFDCPTICRAADENSADLPFLEGHPLVTRSSFETTLSEWQRGILSTRDFAASVRRLNHLADVDDWPPAPPGTLYSRSLLSELLRGLANAAPALTYSDLLASRVRSDFVSEFRVLLGTPVAGTEEAIEMLEDISDRLEAETSLCIDESDPCFFDHADATEDPR